MTVEPHTSEHAGLRTARTALLGAGVIAIDQATKVAAVYLASAGLTNPTRNESFILGFFDRADIRVPLAAVLAMAGIITVLVIRDHLGPVAGGLLAGGALANIYDRLLRGAVIDWLTFGDLVLNLADVAMVAGLIAFGARRWRLKRRPSSPPLPTPGLPAGTRPRLGDNRATASIHRNSRAAPTDI